MSNPVPFVGKNVIDSRPLPLIVAEKWSFPLTYVIENEIYWYSITDWVAGLTDTRYPGDRWGELRKMMQIAFVFEPSNELLRQNYESLKLLKVSSAGIGGKERSKRALNHDEINAVLGVWKDDSLQARRNYTLLALLFASGLRRSEVVVLRWDDLDLERGVLYVRHGKGDKSEEIAIFGEFALNALREWRDTIGSERQFVFCPLSMKDNGNEIDEDRAMDAADANRRYTRNEREFSRVAGLQWVNWHQQ